MVAGAEPDVESPLIEITHLSLSEVDAIDKPVLAAAVSRAMSGPRQESWDMVAAFNNYI